MDQPAAFHDPKSIGVMPTFTSALAAAWGSFPSLLAVNAVFAVPVIGFLVIGCPTLIHQGFTPARGAAPEIPAHEWIALAGVGMFALAFGAWAYAATFRMADAALGGASRPGVGAAFGESLDRVPAVFGAYLATMALTAAGCLFCLLPGMWVAIALLAAPVRAATRSRGPIEAIRDSFELVRGRWWRVFGYLLLVGLCAQAIYLPLGLPLQLLAANSGSTGVWLVALALVLSVILGVFQAVCVVALHRRLEELGPVGGRPTAWTSTPPDDDVPAPEP